MNKVTILIIEDDPDIQNLLSLAFKNEGWKLIMAKTGEEGLELIKKEKTDCIVLDIMLPGMDGFKTLKKIRALDSQEKNTPVIMATARGEEADIVAGLELGADDYVVKPYSPKVLAARIRTVLRRLEENQSEKTQFRIGELTLDTIRHEAYNRETLLELSATEFSLLKHFLSHPNMVFSRNQIISAVHGSDYPVTDRSVDVQILSLRRKLADAGSLIETIRGVGYRFRTQ
ncbi:MAG: response regulator transcription factor [Treponema sp.]|nr:response regulator transcription factor [Treponema sp.]